MNSRERLKLSLNHKEPDKIPIELNGTANSSLTKEAYRKLRAYLGMEEDKNINVSWITMGTVRAKEDLLIRYEIDTRPVYFKPSKITTIEFLPDGSFYDEFGAIWKPASYYYDVVERPMANIERASDLKYVKWPDPYDKTMVEGLKVDVKKLFEETDYCLVADFHTLGPFEGGCYLRGFENFLIDLYSNESFVEALLNKLTDYCIARWEILLGEVGDYVQVVCQGDDLGTQNMPYISPKIYRKYIKPLHKKIYDSIKVKTKAKILFHSCGSIYDLIPDFIEAGIDILNPIQRSAAKMDIEKLKRQFGNDISFWGGGIDVQQQLPNFTLKQIEDEIKKTINIMAPGGGFVFFSTHNIQPDVSPDKIDFMFKTVLKNRSYLK